jgi:P27 family predicted phage terminase small subunit
MAGQRQPTSLLLATGKKHLTKSEIEERLNSEVQPLTDNITAPDYLTKKQKNEFYTISEQLKRLNIMSETDVDTLARFIISRDLYIKLSKQLVKKEVIEDPYLTDKYLKNQDRAFKQCRACAIDLGLTISSRCKLVVPQVNKVEEKPNKFNSFKKDNGVS